MPFTITTKNVLQFNWRRRTVDSAKEKLKGKFLKNIEHDLFTRGQVAAYLNSYRWLNRRQMENNSMVARCTFTISQLAGRFVSSELTCDQAIFFYEWIIPVIPRKREQFVFSPRFFKPSSFIQHLLLSSSWLLNKDDWSTTKASYPHSWHPCLRKAWYSGYWFLKAEIPAPVLRSRNALATCHLHWEVTWPMLPLNNHLESYWCQK